MFIRALWGCINSCSYHSIKRFLFFTFFSKHSDSVYTNLDVNWSVACLAQTNLFRKPYLLLSQNFIIVTGGMGRSPSGVQLAVQCQISFHHGHIEDVLAQLVLCCTIRLSLFLLRRLIKCFSDQECHKLTAHTRLATCQCLDWTPMTRGRLLSYEYKYHLASCSRHWTKGLDPKTKCETKSI